VRPGRSRVNGFEIFAHPTELELLHPRARTRVKRAPGSFDRGGAMRQPRAGTRTQDGGHDGRRLWAYRFRPGGRDIPSPTSPRCKPSTPKVPRRRPLIRTANVTVALLLSPEGSGDRSRPSRHVVGLHATEHRGPARARPHPASACLNAAAVQRAIISFDTSTRTGLVQRTGINVTVDFHGPEHRPLRDPVIRHFSIAPSASSSTMWALLLDRRRSGVSSRPR
jgi:hypothetical protein